MNTWTIKFKAQQMVHIIDLNGCPIEVTDLKEAIKVAGRYRAHRHKDKSFSDFDKRQSAYWMDMYEKLSAIKNNETKS